MSTPTVADALPTALAFEPNVGQFPEDIQFQVTTADSVVAFTPAAVRLTLPTPALIDAQRQRLRSLDPREMHQPTPRVTTLPPPLVVHLRYLNAAATPALVGEELLHAGRRRLEYG